MKKLLLVLVALILVGGGYLLATRTTNTTAQPVSSDMPIVGASGVVETVVSGESETKEFTVDGVPFTFTPKEIRVKKGDRIAITFINKQGMHDFVIDEFNTRTNVLKAGESETITFVADRAGTFEYYCSVGNHRAQGMVGKLIVEE